MEITLEQIEMVKDRTGVSYKEAKEALEYANGNVVDAIIHIEESINNEYEIHESGTVGRIMDAIKDTIKAGNVTKIRVYKGSEVILNIPVTVGAVATFVFPWGIIAAAVAAAAANCKVEMIAEDGTIINVNEKASGAYATLKRKGSVVVDEIKDRAADYTEVVKEKGSELYNQAKEKGYDLYEQAKAKGGEIYENTKDRVSEYIGQRKSEEIFDISDLDFGEDEED